MSVKELNKQAMEEAEKGNYENAIELLNQARQIDENDSDTYKNFGEIYLRLKEYPDAIKCFEIAIDKMSKVSKTEIAKARIRVAQIQYDYACESKDKFLFDNALENIKQIFAETKSIQKFDPQIISDCTKLKSEILHKYTQEVRQLFPSIFDTTKTDSQAASESKKEIENSIVVSVLIEYAENVAKLGKKFLALNTYSEILKTNPRNKDIYLNIGNILSDIGLFELAIIVFNPLLTLNISTEASRAIILVKIGECYRALKNFASAFKSFSDASSLDPKFADASYFMGLNYLDDNQPQLAIHAFQATLKKDPKHILAKHQINSLRIRYWSEITSKTETKESKESKKEMKDSKDAQSSSIVVTSETKDPELKTTITKSTTTESKTPSTNTTITSSHEPKFIRAVAMGGSSIVWEGVMDGKVVAFKQLLVADDFDFLDLEEKALRDIGNDSPYTIHFIASLKVPRCLVLEWVSKSLSQALNTETISWENRYSIAIDITRGLKHIHGAKYLHRDLKASNILLITGAKYSAKIIDFGLAGPMEEKISPGALQWQAPEVLEGSPCTEKSDVYNLGVSLW